MRLTNYSQGHFAESVAAEYLVKQGYTIVATNWKNRWCEIDIIAKQSDVVYFVEVKYRKTNNQGKGLDYITPKKVRQMQFAAEFWVQTTNWQGDYQLAAVEVSGADFQISAFITNIY